MSRDSRSGNLDLKKSVGGRPPVAGAILVGGRSRRLGRDKARLKLGGRPMLARAADALGALTREIFLVGAAGDEYAEFGLPVRQDLFPGCGPLAGIHAALAQADGADVFVLACDLPLVTGEVVTHVAEYRSEGGAPTRVRIAEEAGRIQPLCGLYSSEVLAGAEASLRAGRLAVREFVRKVGCLAVSLDEPLPFYRRGMLENLNTPDDLARIEALLAEAEATGNGECL